MSQVAPPRPTQPDSRLDPRSCGRGVCERVQMPAPTAPEATPDDGEEPELLNLSAVTKLNGVSVEALRLLVSDRMLPGIVRGRAGHVKMRAAQVPSFTDVAELLNHQLVARLKKAQAQMRRVETELEAVRNDIEMAIEDPLADLGHDFVRKGHSGVAEHPAGARHPPQIGQRLVVGGDQDDVRRACSPARRSAVAVRLCFGGGAILVGCAALGAASHGADDGHQQPTGHDQRDRGCPPSADPHRAASPRGGHDPSGTIPARRAAVQSKATTGAEMKP
jgi:hypothetical protein